MIFGDSEDQDQTKIIINVDDKGQVFALSLDGDNDWSLHTPYMARGEFLRRTRTVKPQIKIHGIDRQRAQMLADQC